MNFKKSKFEEFLHNGNYSNCIYLLDAEIKGVLTKKVKSFDENFTYVNLNDLKNKCIEYLDYPDRINAIKFYNLSINPINEQQELQNLFSIYEQIK